MHTPEQIEKWARESEMGFGFHSLDQDGRRLASYEGVCLTAIANLTRFAALVAQHERERLQSAPRYYVRKETGSQYARVYDRATETQVRRFDIFRNDGWERAEALCQKLNAPTAALAEQRTGGRE